MLSAVKVMYAGAVLSAIELALALLSTGSLQSAIHKADPSYSASHVHNLAMSYVAATVITQVAAIGLWLAMSWANRLGMSWARVVASCLFALNSWNLLEFVRQPTAIGPLVLNTLVWVTGLGATVLLWQRDSSAFFTATKQFRESGRLMT